MPKGTPANGVRAPKARKIKEERFNLSVTLAQMEFIVEATSGATGCMEPDDSYTTWCEEQAEKLKERFNRWKDE